MTKFVYRVATILCLIVAVVSCGDGSTSIWTRTSTSTSTSASANLIEPIGGKFAWNISTAISVTLKDPVGTAIASVSCQSDDLAVVEVAVDCSKITVKRLGEQRISVSGGGYSARLVLQGVPQRHWSGATGNNDFSLLARSDGTALAWGDNEYGLLGQGKPQTASSSEEKLVYSSVPLPVQNASLTGSLSGIYQVSGGRVASLALTEEGKVWGWGKNASCELAQTVCGNTIYLPVQIRNSANNGALTNVVQVVTGDSNQAALLDDGTVVTWGQYTGQGDTKGKNFPGFVKTPDGQAVLRNIVAISAGTAFTTALDNEGKVYAWGYDLGDGRLGAGKTITTASSLPNTVKKLDGSDLTNIMSISSGYNFTLAIDTNGSVWGWGDNSFGQLGQNSEIYNGVPYAVQIKGPLGSTGLLSNIVMVAAGGSHSLALDNTGKVYAWGFATSGQLGDGADREAGNRSLLPRPVIAEDGLFQLNGVASIAAGYNTSSALKTNGVVLMWGNAFQGRLGRGVEPVDGDLFKHSPVPGPVVADATLRALIVDSLASYPNLKRRGK